MVDDTVATEDTQPYDVATAADPRHVMSVDQFDPTKTIDALSGKYHGNSRECVASVQQLNNLPRTSEWKPLGPVAEDTQIGAPIAVFNKDGQYTNTPGQSHAATYLGVDANGSMIVGEQYQGKGGAWHISTVPATGRGDWRDASAYRVIGTKDSQPAQPDEGGPPSRTIPKIVPPPSVTPEPSPGDPPPPSRAIPGIRPDEPPPTLPPAATTEAAPGSVADRALRGFHHGFVSDVFGPMVSAIDTLPGVAWMNKQFPALGRLDANLRPATPEQEAEYNRVYGNDDVSNIARFAGQTTAISPLLLATEGAGAGLATRFASPLSKVIPGMTVTPVTGAKIAGAAIRLGSGAVQGVEQALASGGNMLHDAASSAIFHGLGQGLEKAAEYVPTILSNPVVAGTIAGVASRFAGGTHVEAIRNGIETAVAAGVAKLYPGAQNAKHMVGNTVKYIMEYGIAPVLKYGAGPLGDIGAKTAAQTIEQYTKAGSGTLAVP